MPPLPRRAETTNIVYMTMNGVELPTDVSVPAGDGPWPIVVSFHGLDSAGRTNYRPGARTA